VERTEGRFPNWTTISADDGPVGEMPVCPFHITTNADGGPVGLRVLGQPDTLLQFDRMTIA